MLGWEMLSFAGLEGGVASLAGALAAKAATAVSAGGRRNVSATFEA